MKRTLQEIMLAVAFGLGIPGLILAVAINCVDDSLPSEKGLDSSVPIAVTQPTQPHQTQP